MLSKLLFASALVVAVRADGHVDCDGDQAQKCGLNCEQCITPCVSIADGAASLTLGSECTTATAADGSACATACLAPCLPYISCNEALAGVDLAALLEGAAGALANGAEAAGNAALESAQAALTAAKAAFNAAGCSRQRRQDMAGALDAVSDVLGDLAGGALDSLDDLADLAGDLAGGACAGLQTALTAAEQSVAAAGGSIDAAAGGDGSSAVSVSASMAAAVVVVAALLF